MQWLIDGHNLIGQMPDLRLDAPNDEEILLERLRRYRAATGHTITVIFDPGMGYRPGSIKKRGGITIQFAPPGQTADQVIIRRVNNVKNRQGMMVVTSDRAVRNAAVQQGIRVLSAAEFTRQLQPNSSGTPSDHDRGSQKDVNLSPTEIDEWLNLFNQQ